MISIKERIVVNKKIINKVKNLWKCNEKIITKEEAYILMGYSAGIRRKILAKELGISRQSLHMKFLLILIKILGA